MALIGNCALRHKSPAKYTTGTVGFNDRANWNKPGMMRNRGDLTVTVQWKYDAVPSGFYAGRAFFSPQKAGRMTSRPSFSLGGTATGTQGLPGSGSADIILSASGIGGLIAGGVGTATITITSTGSIVATTGTTGSSTISLGAVANPGAIGWLVGDSTLTITGEMISYAKGFMQGTTEDQGLTVAGITNSVWNAILANYNTAGTAGKALSTAGSGGVDLEALAAAILAAAEVTPIHADTRKVNGIMVDGSGTTGDPWGPV